MALARIITRSQACSRELALDLLARGYAVEIVSPDAIPDNIADLELRVDTDPGNRLVASVESHQGERSASLEFVHYLKAPMGDFVRRSPVPLELPKTVCFPEQTISLSAEPSVEDVEIPAAIPLDPQIEGGVRRITMLEQLPSPPEVPTYFAVEESTVAQPAKSRHTFALPRKIRVRLAPPWRNRSAGWGWRAALTFASVLTLAVLLAFGIRRTGGAAAQDSELGSEERVVEAAADAGVPSAADSHKVSSSSTSPVMLSDRNSGHPMAEEARVAKPAAATARASTAAAKAGISHKRVNDLIARDTVTYLDQRFEYHPSDHRAAKAKPPKRLARKRSRPHKQDGGVIAANSTTYLNQPAPKTVK
jgi:hypothetical protein